MKSTPPAPIVAEVLDARDEYAALYGYDVAAMFRDLRARQEVFGREYVGYSARHVPLKPEDLPEA